LTRSDVRFARLHAGPHECGGAVKGLEGDAEHLLLLAARLAQGDHAREADAIAEVLDETAEIQQDHLATADSSARRRPVNHVEPLPGVDELYAVDEGGNERRGGGVASQGPRVCPRPLVPAAHR